MAHSSTQHLCSRCLNDPPPFIWLKTASVYNDPVAKAVQKFKYQGKTSMAPALAQCILEQLGHDIREFNPQLLVPVPLHITRLRQRGYNQALLISRQLARNLQLPVCVKALQRTSATSSQTTLNAQQRLDNLRNAFAIGMRLPPQRILLVDDVVTTTATARTCSAILQQQGHLVAVVAMGRATLT